MLNLALSSTAAPEGYGLTCFVAFKFRIRSPTTCICSTFVVRDSQYDVVTIVEAPDDVTMTALGLATGKLGNVRTQTLRAFSAAVPQDVLSFEDIAGCARCKGGNSANAGDA
jgi:hypothetical protein